MALHHIKFNKLEEAEAHVNSAISISDRIHQKAREVTYQGLRLQVCVAKSELGRAEEIIKETELLIHEIGRLAIAPYCFSRYAIGVTLFRIAQLENAVSSPDKSAISRYNKSALKSVKEVISMGKKIAQLEPNRSG